MAQKKDEEEQVPREQQENKDSDTNNDSSMINRVQSSASGLLRNALAGSGANDLNAEISNTLSSTGKASSSQGSRTTGILLSTETSEVSSNAPGTTRNGEQSLQSESFRSGVTAPEDGLAENFQETQTNDLLYDLSDTKGKGTSSNREELTPQQHSLKPDETSTFNTAWNTNTQHQHAQNAQPDGSAVVDLLSSPSFQPDDPSFPEEPEQSLEEEDEPTLSPSEIELINSFRRHPTMPTPSSLHDPTPINPLSLIPDISNQQPDPSQQTTESSLRSSNLPGISEWIDLDKNYHAEVWGYLRPHIRAAMDEIEERRGKGKEQGGGEGEGEKDGPAVRRLQMILRHMRGV